MILVDRLPHRGEHCPFEESSICIENGYRCPLNYDYKVWCDMDRNTNECNLLRKTDEIYDSVPNCIVYGYREGY